jgi:hypothetical protein
MKCVLRLGSRKGICLCKSDLRVPVCPGEGHRAKGFYSARGVEKGFQREKKH